MTRIEGKMLRDIMTSDLWTDAPECAASVTNAQQTLHAAAVQIDTDAAIERCRTTPPQGRTPFYMHLFHGRPSPDTSLEDWGTDGPVLRIEGAHMTYGDIRVGILEHDEWFELETVDGLIYYDGAYYGDVSFLTLGTDPDLTNRAVLFEVNKATLPSSVPSQVSVDPPAAPLDVMDTFDSSWAEDEDDMPASNEELDGMVREMADVMEAFLVRCKEMLPKGEVELLQYWLMKGRVLTDTAPEGYTLPEFEPNV